MSAINPPPFLIFPLLGLYRKKPCVCGSVICNSQDLEAAHVPMRGRVDRKAVVHLRHEILLTHKEGILSFTIARMGLECITLSETSQSEKDKLHDFTYVWNNAPNKLTNNKKNMPAEGIITHTLNLFKYTVHSKQRWVTKKTRVDIPP